METMKNADEQVHGEGVQKGPEHRSSVPEEHEYPPTLRSWGLRGVGDLSCVTPITPAQPP